MHCVGITCIMHVDMHFVQKDPLESYLSPYHNDDDDNNVLHDYSSHTSI